MANSDIQGTVTDADENAVEGATIEVFEQDGTTVARTTTDSNGQYLIDSSIISGDGPWHITARYDDGAGNQYNAPSKPFVSADLTTITVVDDFEDGGITEYGGDTGDFSVQQTVVQGGSYALESTGTTAKRAITETDELTHPQQGDTFEHYLRMSDVSSGNAAALFAVQSETIGTEMEGYGGLMNPAGGDFQLNRYDSGTKNQLDSQSVSWTAGEWYRVEVQWETDGSITITLFDSSENQIAQVSATDTTYTSGGVGWTANHGSSSASIFADNYQIL